MKSFILLIVLGSMFLFTNPAKAEDDLYGLVITKGGWFACLTEQILSEAPRWIKPGDPNDFQYLIDAKVCVQTEEGVAVSVVERKWDEWTVKIRSVGWAENKPWWTTIDATY